mmetsp:Transcript_64749/g.72378  ORF Transcript_64749/g.72378 Transcript_64749/m.72378 type:complete len:175 (+) Transcript_64749:353-877(+)
MTVAVAVEIKKPRQRNYFIFYELLPNFPIELDRLRNSVVILDKSNTPTTSNDKEDAEVEAEASGWFVNWKTNFEAIQIPSLRSPTTAHLDPYNHRALDAYANVTHQATAQHLVPLPYLTQRIKNFMVPTKHRSLNSFTNRITMKTKKRMTTTQIEQQQNNPSSVLSKRNVSYVH